MGRVLAPHVSHNGHPLNHGANVGLLTLIGCSGCERRWPFTLLMESSP